MTSGNSYKESLEASLKQYRDAYLRPLENYKLNPTLPEDVIALLKLEKDVNNKLNEIRKVSIPLATFDATSSVKAYYDKLDNASNQQRAAINAKADATRTQRQQAHEQEKIDVQNYNQSLINPYKEKHAELLSCRDELMHVFDYYDISPLDMNISDDITDKEFNVLIDECIETCHKYMKKDIPLFDKILSPIKDECNLQFVLSYVLILIVCLYIALPFAAVPIFMLVFKSVHNMYKDLEKLKIAYALMAEVDYNRFVSEDEFKSVDDLSLEDIEETRLSELSEVKDYTEERIAAMRSVDESREEIIKRCNEVTTEVKQAYADVIDNLQKMKGTIQVKMRDLLKDYKPFPTVQNNSVVMSHKYTLGKIENKLDVQATLPLNNIVFDATDRVTAVNNMKLYLANALLSVRVKQLTIEIYDPKNMCGEFTEFFAPETKPYIKPNNMTLDKLMETYKAYSQANIIVLDNKDIDTFNKNAEEQELVPKEYKLLLLVSEFDGLLKGDKSSVFLEYLKFSASSGVMIWLLDTKKYPNTVWVTNNYTLSGSAIKYEPSIGKEAVKTFSTALAQYKDTGIDYVSKFADIYIPREKWWTWDTIKGIDLHFGLENGDPTRGLPVTIGDANVHALLGGATGAGKSAAINQTLISLITMYPPSELQLVYIDFKNVEAAKFTKGFNPDTGEWLGTEEEKALRDKGEYYLRVSYIPHLRIISGTTDGEYALSVFEWLMQEMARRQEIINKYGVTKVEEMRKQILAKYNQEKGTPKGTWADMRKDWDWYKPNVYDKYGDLPRILVIFDEFQVMYNPEFVPTRIIDMINGKITAITKLARAMGCHFWFTSQSMKGTMSKDTMGNFSLRGALRCTDDVSNELLGNGAAGTIKQKFGFMYTNDSAGTDKDANRFWRVPFLDEKKIGGYVDELNKMLPEFNEKHLMAEFYDEKILVPSTKLDERYNVYYDHFKDGDVFVLGERASFSTNKAPVTCTLLNDTGENLCVTAFDRNDLLNLILTLVVNLQKSEDALFMMNVQDKETHTLLDVNNIVDERFASFSNVDQDVKEFVEALEAMIDGRYERGAPYKPLYVFCVQWERAPYVSVDENFKVSEKFKELLRKGPSVGVHFVMCCKEKLSLSKAVVNACNHRIAGMIPKDSFFFIENAAVEKYPDATKDAGLFALYEFGKTNAKFCIYQHEFKGVIKSREIVIE